jgi:Flp pilus assembly protein TadG
MCRLVRHVLRDEKGGTAVLAAMAFPVILAGAAAALTYSGVTSTRASYQNALDGAVLAATILPMTATNGDRIRAAEAAFAGGTSARADGVTAGKSAHFTVEPVGSDDVKVTGDASVEVKNYFGSFIGGSTIPVGLRAAAQKAASDPLCALALNNSANGAVDLNGTVDVSTNCPVQANSGDSAAVRAVGNASMKTKVFGVTGDAKGKDAFSPAPTPGSSRIPDPLAQLPFPSAGPCAPLSGGKVDQNISIPAGTYCGGLEITSGAVVKLDPGVYIFKDGEFKVSSGAQVTGDQVLLGLTGKGAKFWMTGGAVMKLTSPISGPYMNIQFMEDISATGGNHWVSIGGDSKLDYDGIMYFPNCNIWIFGGSEVTGKSPNLIMIGDKLWFQDNSKVVLTQANTRNLPVKETPRLRYGAKLVN